MSRQNSRNAVLSRRARNAQNGPHFLAQSIGSQPLSFEIGEMVQVKRTGAVGAVERIGKYGDYKLKNLDGWYRPALLRRVET